MTLLLIIWCVPALVHWLYIVFKEGCIRGEDLFFLPFCIVLGLITPIVYWANATDPIYIPLRRKK